MKVRLGMGWELSHYPRLHYQTRLTPNRRRRGAQPQVVTVISCPAVLHACVRARRPEKPVVVSPSRVDGLVAIVTGVQQ